MANLDKLAKITTRSRKRVGRGYGSGKGGHTSSRGAKGRKARGKVSLSFTGTKTKKSFIARLPLQRGKGKFKPKSKPEIVDIASLSVFKDGQEVTLETLVKKGIVSKKALKTGVKVLNNGKLEKNLEIKVACSKSIKSRKNKLNKKATSSK